MLAVRTRVTRTCWLEAQSDAGLADMTMLLITFMMKVKCRDEQRNQLFLETVLHPLPVPPSLKFVLGQCDASPRKRTSRTHFPFKQAVCATGVCAVVVGVGEE